MPPKAVSGEGEVFLTFQFPKDGDYILTFRGYGQQVGGERVRYGIRLDGQQLKAGEVRSSEARMPGQFEVVGLA